MKFYEKYKQQYLNYKEAFDYIFDPKNEKYLIEYLGENETKIYKLVFNTFIERLNNDPDSLFQLGSVISVDQMKQVTGLSYYQQRNAIYRLEKYFKVIKSTFGFTRESNSDRAFEINFENLWNIYNNFTHFKYTSIKIKKMNKDQLIQLILKNEDRLAHYLDDDFEEEEEF